MLPTDKGGYSGYSMVSIVTLLVVGLSTVLGKPSPQMSNIEGDATSDGCNIGVMKNRTVSEGKLVHLRCPLTLGSTCMVSNIKWFKSDTIDGERKEVQSAYKQFPLKFFIQGAYAQDSGFYWCVTTNFHVGAGDLVEASAYVKVGNAPPKAPIVTTQTPIVTTEAPIVTTEAPIVTTEAPIVETEAPIVVTEAPTVAAAPPTSAQPTNEEERKESIEAILGSHLGTINHQLAEINTAIRDFGKRITALEIKKKDLKQLVKKM